MIDSRNDDRSEIHSINPSFFVRNILFHFAVFNNYCLVHNAIPLMANTD